MLKLLGVAPYRGRRRARSLRDWPVGWTAAVDPWQGAPLFSVALEQQARRAAVVRGYR